MTSSPLLWTFPGEIDLYRLKLRFELESEHQAYTDSCLSGPNDSVEIMTIC